jgi:hypothetical protein
MRVYVDESRNPDEYFDCAMVDDDQKLQVTIRGGRVHHRFKVDLKSAALEASHSSKNLPSNGPFVVDERRRWLIYLDIPDKSQGSIRNQFDRDAYIYLKYDWKRICEDSVYYVGRSVVTPRARPYSAENSGSNFQLATIEGDIVQPIPLLQFRMANWRT